MPITLELLAIDIRTSIYEMYISGILMSVTQGQVDFATSPLGISQWENNGRRLFGRKPFEILSNIGLLVDLTH